MPLPPALLEFARKMRKEQTDAEQLLWHLLRNRNFCGFKFRRQYPIGGYILDFFCDELNLAIELDGSGHADIEQLAYDEERTKILNGVGIKVLRFWNHELLTDTEAVLEAIYGNFSTDA
jgi:very-short-patch-repair endonuclease